MQGIQAAKILQLQHSLHSQAALNLLMGGASTKQPNKQPEIESADSCLEKPSSFSRQTTWEGIDTASAAFSRGTSLASAWDPLPDRTAGVPPPLPELSEWQVQVKNTFIEVSDSDTSDTEQDQGVLRRTRSVPLF